MGLTPVTEKSIKQGSGSNLTYCRGSMQAYTKIMEDSSIQMTDVGDGNSIFAVFDGHGGSSNILKVI